MSIRSKSRDDGLPFQRGAQLQAEKRNEHRARAQRLTLLITAVLALTIVLLSAPKRKPEHDFRRRIVAAAGECRERPIEGRIHGFPYAPLLSHSRGATVRPENSMLSLRAAVSAAVANTDRGENANMAGLAYLLQGEYDEAVETLSGYALSARDAHAFNDLAAAYVARGTANADPRDFALALAAADGALRLQFNLVEARFNRALALQHLHLDEAATAEYERFLRLEPSSGWASEAVKRKKALTDLAMHLEWKSRMPKLVEAVRRGDAETVLMITRAHRGEARPWSEVVILNDWAKAYASGGGADDLEVARAVGDALVETNGEYLLRDAVRTIDEAVATDRERARTIASAQREYYDARLLYSRRLVRQSIPGLDRARRLFAAGSSPMAYVAAYYLANARFDADDADRAEEDLMQLRVTIPPRYRALTAQIAWELGTIAGAGGEVHRSIREYGIALAAFETLGEEANAATMRASLGLMLTTTGRTLDAWRLRVAAFEHASRTSDSARLEFALTMAARAALQLRQFDVARSLLTVSLEREHSNPRLRFDAYVSRALCAWRAGDLPDDDLRDAHSVRSVIADPQLREAAESDLMLIEAAIVAKKDPHRAITLTTDHIKHVSRSQKSLYLPTALLERARAFRAIGNVDAAVSDLRNAIELLETRRGRIADADLRDTFFDANSAVFEELIVILDARGDHRAMLDICERQRARLLSDRLAGAEWANVRPLAPEQIAAALPDGAVLAEYQLFADHVVIMVIDRSGFRAVSVATNRNALMAARRKLVVAAQGGNVAGVRAAGGYLHQLLIRPLANTLRTANLLIIVPDDDLDGVPFAALADPETNRYLLDDVPILIAPSASAFARDGAPATAKHPRALIVGDPEIDATELPDLPRLSFAADEAREIASAYRTSAIIGAAATRRTVIELLAECDVAHIGAHALWCSYDPSYSLLAFAPDNGKAGALYVRDIVRLSLPRRPVVVLAACRSAAATQESGTVRSIATAFLAAGARNVVATLWNVDDELARALSVRFHAELARGLTPALALRNAQAGVRDSHGSSSIGTWSALQIIGTSN